MVGKLKHIKADLNRRIAAHTLLKAAIMMLSEDSPEAITGTIELPRDPRLLLQDYLSHLCHRFILDCLQCSEDPPPRYRSVLHPDRNKLLYIIAYTLYMANFDDRIIFGALLLLQRLNARLPFIDPAMAQFYREFGYAAFIGALMIARKELFEGKDREQMGVEGEGVNEEMELEEELSDQIWVSITGRVLNLSEVQMVEMALRSADAGLNGDTEIDVEELKRFEAIVRREYGVVILPYKFPDEADGLELDLASLRIAEN